MIVQVDQNHYPDWQRFINSLYSNGIKVLTYINPLVTDITKRGTPYQHNYYQEGIDNGYFIKQGDGSVWIGYSNASMIDLSNPKAYQWVMNMIVEVSSYYAVYYIIIVNTNILHAH